MTFAQTKTSVGASGGGGGGAGTSITPQTGFVYYLKYKKHLQYACTYTSTYYFTANDLDRHWGDSSWRYVWATPGRVTSLKLVFDRKVRDRMNRDPMSFTDYDMRFFYPQSYEIDTSKRKSKFNRAYYVDTILIVQIQLNDSLPRYWPGNRSSWFTKSRLKLSITQDTDVLATRIAYTDFNSSGPPDTVNVTNINDNGKLPTEGFLVKAFLKSSNSTISMDSLNTRFTNWIGSFYKIAEVDRPSRLASWESFYQVIMRSRYIVDVRNAHELIDTGHLGKNEIKAIDQKLTKEYEILYHAYGELERIYYNITYARNLTLNKMRKQVEDSDPDSLLSFEMAYIREVNKVNGGVFTRLDPLVTNVHDELIHETAIPISNTDSAANFYIKVVHKNFVSQQVFFQKFHFGVYDYGTLTVPYRYRFAPKRAHLFNQSGKDSIVSAPSESDATLSLAVYAGRKWGHTRYYDDPSMTRNMFSVETAVFTGPTLIPLGASNIDTSSKYTGVKTNYVYSGPSNLIAWSVGGGAVAEWRTINFGFFAGWDFPLTPHTGWVYRDKIWIGFGIGVNLGMFNSGKSVN